MFDEIEELLKRDVACHYAHAHIKDQAFCNFHSSRVNLSIRALIQAEW